MIENNDMTAQLIESFADRMMDMYDLPGLSVGVLKGEDQISHSQRVQELYHEGSYGAGSYIPLCLGVQTFHVGGDNEACRRRGDSIG